MEGIEAAAAAATVEEDLKKSEAAGRKDRLVIGFSKAAGPLYPRRP